MFAKKGITEENDGLASVQKELDLLKEVQEFTRFLTEQLQDQAAALLGTGFDAVAKPSPEMVAAMACSWLVGHQGWKKAVVIGIQEKALITYADYPPTKDPKFLATLLSLKGVSEAAFASRLTSTVDQTTKEAEELRALLAQPEVVLMPLQSSTANRGCLVVAGEPQEGVEAMAAEIARALELAVTLGKLSEQTQKLRELDAIRISFINTTSHQLRTPLSIVKWMFSVFLTDPELAKMDKQMQMLKQAYSGVERIVDVVNDLLNANRIQNGKLPFVPQEADAKAIIEEVIKEMTPVADSKGIKLTVELSDKLKPFSFDAILFREAVENLTNNAVDYNREKGEIAIKTELVDEWLELSVTNTGPGIKKDETDHIFTPLYRSDMAMLLRPDGSGLGLYLAKAIAVAHGGSLTFESIPDKLTTFTLRIPLKPVKS